MPFQIIVIICLLCYIKVFYLHQIFRNSLNGVTNQRHKFIKVIAYILVPLIVLAQMT